MAKFWVGGTGTWDGSTTTNWANSTGGAGGATVPGATDDVFFDTNSGTGTCTINASVVCNSIQSSGSTLHTLSHNAAFTVSIGSGTAGASNIALDFSGFTTYTLGNVTTSALTFVSTSATVQTINFNSLATGNVTYNATSNGSWQYTSGHTGGAAMVVTLTKGTLDINGQTCSWGGFNSDNSNVRTLSLGAANITLTQSSTAPLPWVTNTTTSLTFNPSTSTISLSATNANLSSSTITFNNVSFTNTGAGVPVILNQGGATITFSSLTCNGGAVKQQGLGLSGNIVVTTMLTLTGNSPTNRLLVRSQILGTARTVTAAAVTLSNVDFRDITGAGAAAPFTGSSLGNIGGNSNITTTAPVTRYWVATSGGNWSATTSWSTSTGGSSGASVPLIQDTVVFDANSITSTSKTITGDMARLPAIDFTNILNSPSFNPSLSSAGTGNEIYGSWTLKSGMSSNGVGTFNFTAYPSNITITSNGVSFVNPFGFTAIAGSTTITLADNFVSTGGQTHNQGTFTVNGNFTCPNFVSSNSSTRTINMGTGTWTLTGTGTIFNSSNFSGLTFNSQTSTVLVTDISATTKLLDWGTKTLNALTLTGGNTGATTVAGHNGTATTFTINAPNNVIIPITNTFTVTNLNATGSAGNIITIHSQTPGTPGTISKAGGTVTCDYLSLQDSAAAGGATWYAGANSTNVSGNSGWIFQAAPRIARPGGTVGSPFTI